MKKIVTIVLLGTVIGLLAGGCGGTGTTGSTTISKADYVKQIKALENTLSSSITSVGSATSATSAATILATAQTELHAAVKTLQSMSPPTAVKAAHEQLTAAISELANELGPVIAKLKAGDFGAMATLTSLKGLQDLRAAAAAFKKAGYPIGSGA